MKNKSKTLFFYAVLILIPILFFAVLEFSLRFAEYGENYAVFTEVKPGWLEVNPNLARKYFRSVKKTPSTNKDVFRAVKPANGYRVFVLGGSSGAGYPYIPLGSFTRYIRKRLEIAYPARKIEVVNMSMTAINSYTLLDVLPEVLKQKPDLILIYAGHNEYYGALGVGSMENIGSNPYLVNLMLKLENYKTFQLVRNIVSGIVTMFLSDEKPKTGTLMSRMAEKKKIPFKSELYREGLRQFETNLSAIIEKAKESRTPVVLSTLACNLFDTEPFISEKSDRYPPASDIYRKAVDSYGRGEVAEAESLFVYAKDLDMLRFRAPREINEIIKKLAHRYNLPLADAYSALKKASKRKIIGNDLMTDHLHPTLRGYQIIGKTFYETMAKNRLLPKEKPAVQFGFQDRITLDKYDFTELDSISAAYKIKFLKNDWPFINPDKKLSETELIKTKTFADSLALDFVIGKIDWIEAHLKLAERYYKNKSYDKYVKAMSAIVSQFPIVPRFYETAVTKLIEVNRLEDAYEFLLKEYATVPNAFSAKWLGILNLKKGKNNAAIFYLKKSLDYYNRDAQVYYNLAGAYLPGKEYAKALNEVNKALSVNPDYTQALNLKKQLESILKTHTKKRK